MSKRKRQFTHSKVKPRIFDRKVQRQGTSVVLSLTKLIPKHWLYVRIVPLEEAEKKLVIAITPLWTVEDNARTIEDNPKGEQHT